MEHTAEHPVIDVVWNPPEPRGVPALRATMVERLLSDYEIDRTADMVERQRMARIKHLSCLESARLFLTEEHGRLASAALYYVSADMTRLAVAASRSMPPFNIEREDVPAPAGFMVFEEPVYSYDTLESSPDVQQMRVPTVALSWGPTRIGYESHPDSLWITLWRPGGGTLLDAVDLVNQSVTPPSARDWFLRTYSPLQWQSEAMWPLGADRAAFGSATVLDTTLDALRAAWLLMQQPKIVDVVELERPRAERRRDAREGLSTSPVRVVGLRKIAHDQEADTTAGAARDYACRWLVSGHWRQHWYPKRQVHRPVWIAPHVKGPEDKPLRTTQTVHLWER